MPSAAQKNSLEDNAKYLKEGRSVSSTWATKVVSLAVGSFSNCVVNSAGSTKCWGKSEQGERHDSCPQHPPLEQTFKQIE